jgi:NAD(P)-dependent dehydrogenase (short-subunit alcohol dehydrogenase family)
MALATAKLFVVEGADVFITGRRQQQLEAAVRAIGRKVIGVQGDAANLADLDRLYQRVRDTHGRIDVLYASAGIGELALLGEVTEDHFDRTFGINVRGTLLTVQKALPLLSDGASIIMSGSIASIKGFERFRVYNASKAALRSFARTWTAELKARNIRVNVLSPGTIEMGIFDHIPKEIKRPARSTHSSRYDWSARGDRHRRPLPRLERLHLCQRHRVVRRRRHGPDLNRGPRPRACGRRAPRASHAPPCGGLPARDRTEPGIGVARTRGSVRYQPPAAVGDERREQ